MNGEICAHFHLYNNKSLKKLLRISFPAVCWGTNYRKPPVDTEHTEKINY